MKSLILSLFAALAAFAAFADDAPAAAKPLDPKRIVCPQCRKNARSRGWCAAHQIGMVQDLSIVGLTPFGADWKLLVAFERAHGTAVSEPTDETATANRLLGGVAVAF